MLDEEVLGALERGLVRKRATAISLDIHLVESQLPLDPRELLRQHARFFEFARRIDRNVDRCAKILVGPVGHAPATNRKQQGSEGRCPDTLAHVDILA